MVGVFIARSMSQATYCGPEGPADRAPGYLCTVHDCVCMHRGGRPGLKPLYVTNLSGECQEPYPHDGVDGIEALQTLGRLSTQTIKLHVF